MSEVCTSCGAAVEPGAWYCLACGHAHAAPRPPAPSGARRASVLAALIGVAVLGAAAGAFVERRHDDPAASPITVPTVLTETVTQPARTVTSHARSVVAVSRGGRARHVRRHG
jgi:hypothetical protein